MSRVLVVDDDSAGLAIRRIVLERKGHQVTIASDIESARAMFRESVFESVILDLRLPELEDGLTLIREFRAAAPGVRLIVLAGWSADLDGTIEAGLVDEVISKPSSSQRLVDALERSSAT